MVFAAGFLAGMSNSDRVPVSWLSCFTLRAPVVYLLLVVFPFPLDLLPWLESLQAALTRGMMAIGRIALQAGIGFHDPIPDIVNGSGDRLDLWVAQAGMLLTALVAGAAWAAVARHAAMQARIATAGRFYLRYVLASAMIIYGVSKVTLSQFPAPSVDRLVQPLGEGSPMGLIWTMVGLSPAYQFIGGLLELIAGLLLLSRRTAPAGALLMAGIMFNVALLNYCYDVPVKQYSTQLLLGALVLAAPHFSGLVNLLVLGRPAAPAGPAGTPWSGWRRYAYAGGNLAFAGTTIFFAGFTGSNPPPPDLYATYEVVTFQRDGAPVPALADDPLRWRYFTLTGRGTAIIRSVGGVRSLYGAKTDLATGKIMLTSREQAPEISELSYTQPTADTLTLAAKQAGATLAVKLRRRRPDEFLINNRGFHWINPTPFNR